VITLLWISCIAFPLAAQDGTVRIVQTNAAGDNVHLIDPATHKVVDVIHGIPKAHGVTSSPDGSILYFSNEVDATLDVVPIRTLAVSKQIPLSNRPNNIAITPDGSKLYVAIVAEGLVDVIDTAEGRVVKSIRTLGGVHNVFITPDGRYIAAGMIGARTLTIIDTETDEAVWSLHFGGAGAGGYPDGGVRPITFDTHPDGSTNRIFVQLSNFHGVVVVDFDTRSVVARVEMPRLPLTRQSNDALQGSPGHGLAVSPDGTQLWSTSKPNDHVYAWSLPDLEFLGGVGVGHHPDWLTMTPDGRFLYAANAGSNDVSVIDTVTMEEVARIDVGQTPKRNHTVVIR
jgi:YVTN family beta-propeller protein